MKSKLGFIILAFFIIGINLSAQTFSVDSKDARNQAQFVSDAPFEKIVGVSSGLDATVMINKNNVADKPMGKVKVDIAKIKTGIDLRDEHLRSENWLNAEKFPYAEFKLKSIQNASSNKLSNGQKVKVTLVGDFTVHGVTKEIKVPAVLTYFEENEQTKAKMPGNLLVANAEFSINLSDYGVEIPSMVVGKVNDKVEIDVNFVASDANAGGMNPCASCNPCGTKQMEGKCNPCSMKKANPCNPCAMKKG
ncbi:MAG: YceI family protein [Melioribacteraceae bacterium]|nr:YceI family protein [Melioribacteraceae bacterium]